MITDNKRLSNIIQTIAEIKRGSDIFDYDLASRMLMQLFQLILVDSIEPDEIRIMKELESIMKNNDMILTSDYLIGVVKPYYENRIADLLKQNANEKEIECGDYIVEPTSSGWFTIKNLRRNIYLHSNVNPVSAAEEWIREVYDPNIRDYYIWGLGLGYHLNALFKCSFGAVRMHVFYDNADEYELASKYGEITALPCDIVDYHFDKGAKDFVDSIPKDKEHDLLLHFPSILCIEDEKVKTAMHSFFASWNSAKVNHNQLLVNFRSNRSVLTHNVDELKDTLAGHDVVIIGGGPSLNNAIDYLKNLSKEKYIICATTVLGKLLNNDIRPDFVVVSDPLERTMGHLDGVNRLDIPLIMASTAYWGFADAFGGDKFILYQSQYGLAEEVAKLKGYNIYNTGGTVTSMAIDIAGRLGCRSVELIGIDLSFPGNVTHASGTLDCTKIDTDGMPLVEDVNGNLVKTNTLFMSYKRFIEEQVKDFSDTEFINLSDCGARIEGTKEKSCYGPN